MISEQDLKDELIKNFIIQRRKNHDRLNFSRMLHHAPSVDCITPIKDLVNELKDKGFDYRFAIIDVKQITENQIPLLFRNYWSIRYPMFYDYNPSNQLLSKQEVSEDVLDDIANGGDGSGNGDGGILIIKDVHRALPEVQNYFIALAEDKRCLQWKLGSKWTLIYTADRMTAEEQKQYHWEVHHSLRFSSSNFVPEYAYFKDMVNRWFNDPTGRISEYNSWEEACPNVSFVVDALPEAYCGNPNGPSAVVLSLNPGYSEAVNNKPKTREAHLSEYENYFTAGGDYQQHKECQRFWNKRIGWINRLLGYKSENYPLGIELCPFHSKDFSGPRWSQDVINYVKHVISFASIEIAKSELPFAIAVGRPYYNIFLNKDFQNAFEVTLIKQWDLIDPYERHYALFKIDEAYFLVTWSKIARNSCPGVGFGEFEQKEIIDEYFPR